MVVDRVSREAGAIAADFHKAYGIIGVKYSAIDDLMPPDVAAKIAAAFPPTSELRYPNGLRERKYTSKAFDKFDPLIADMAFAIQDKRPFVALRKRGQCR